VTDILVTNATVITMDPHRRVIDHGAVAITDGRIAEVGHSDELAARHQAARVIDGHDMVAMPGLIDCHGHAGHGLIKTMGSSTGNAWTEACETVYTVASSVDYWRAEARLAALERLKCGVTCGVSLLGGGNDIMRTDEPAYGEAHCKAVAEVGIRSFLAVGPCRPPFPRTFARWEGDRAVSLSITQADQLASCEALIKNCHGLADGKISIALNLPVYGRPGDEDGSGEAIKAQSDAVLAMARDHGLRLTQDGHRNGSIAIAHDVYGLLGPDVFLSHCNNLSEREIALCRETDTKIVHNPSAIASVMARCPAPELIKAGVTVAIGSDGTAPDRGADMFRHMFQCMHHQRSHFHDANVMPAGKVMEMVTIDAAKVLGQENRIGSLEAGKAADVILVDMAKPHLYPPNMPLYRIPNYANGADVDTVIVDGRVLMAGRTVTTVDEAEVLDDARRETVKPPFYVPLSDRVSGTGGRMFRA
jgi:cytosine/adenosine deaminase-related metal-dependent hydrolase